MICPPQFQTFLKERWSKPPWTAIFFNAVQVKKQRARREVKFSKSVTENSVPIKFNNKECNKLVQQLSWCLWQTKLNEKAQNETNSFYPVHLSPTHAYACVNKSLFFSLFLLLTWNLISSIKMFTVSSTGSSLSFCVIDRVGQCAPSWLTLQVNGRKVRCGE